MEYLSLLCTHVKALFLTVWPLNATRHKLASVLLSFSYGRAQGLPEMAFATCIEFAATVKALFKPPGP